MAISSIKKSGIKTDSQIKKIIKEHTDGDDVYSIQGYKGLNLYIRPNKTVTFRHRYTSPETGKRVNFTLGAYPAFSLEDARTKHRENLELLEHGTDPKQHQEIISNQRLGTPTFKQLSQDWMQEQRASNLYQKRTLDQKQTHIDYACEHIGHMKVDAIKTPDVLRAVKAVERSAIPTAKRVRGVCQKIFAYAIGLGYTDNNPAIAVADLMLAKPKTQHLAAIVEPGAFGQLLKDIDSVSDFYGHAKNIIKLQSLLFQRSGDMCSMRWDAIDMDAQTWTFSPAKTGSRADMVASLVVPLPRQAIELLQAIHEQTGHTDYVFYNKRRKDRFEHQQQLNKFLNRLGYTGKHTPHGFRASARTLMVEQLDVSETLIELQLGHNVRDANGRAYNRTQMLAQRADMMQSYADYLDRLRRDKV